MSAFPIPSPLSILCDVTATVASAGVAIPAFNQPLAIGNSGRIPSQGVNSRVRLYPTAGYPANIVADGYEPGDPEFIAAGLFVAQQPPPPNFLLGCQDPSAIAALVFDTGEGGTGYAIGDVFLVTQSSASFGFGIVTSVAAGVVTGAAFIPGRQGTGYSIATGLATVAQSPSVGVGLEVNITAIGETPLQALTACRNASSAWYVAMITTAVDADHVACSTYAQTAQPPMQYLYGTQSLSALTGATGNVFSLIKALSLKRAHGAYSTTQGGGAPSNIYIAAAVAGVAMGRNTGLANSAFTLEGQTLVGIVTEPLTPTQWFVPAGEPGANLGNNGNVYINFANSYTNYEQGVNGDGTFFDQTLGIDMIIADVQISILNGKKALGTSIPQDNSGQTLVFGWATPALQRAVSRGFLAPGTWAGAAIPPLGIVAGTPMPNGWKIGSDSFTNQASGKRSLRQGMPIYIPIILAGSQQSFIIGINVQP